MCSSAPDTSGVNAAALANANISKDALDFYKSAYAEQAPARAAAADRANAISDAQLAGMKSATAQAQDYSDYNKSTFRPLEADIVSKAKDYDTEGNRERLAGLALGDVRTNFANSRDIAQRNLTRAGVNPADGAFGASARASSNLEALAGADAENKARTQATTLGHAMEMDAASLGRGLPSSQATQASLALTAGNNSAANAGLPLSQAQSAVGMMNQGYGTAISGNNSSGNLYGQEAQIQNTANKNDITSMENIGSGLGNAAGFIFSDKKMKTNRKPVKGEVALAAARKMPVATWQYKDDSPAADGGKTHVGPMAQDARAAMGDKAAPGGKMIDLGSLASVALAAVQHLDKGQQRMEKKVASLASARTPTGQKRRTS